MRLGITLALWHIFLPGKVAMTESEDSTPNNTDAMAVDKVGNKNTGRDWRMSANRNIEESKFNTENWKTYIDGTVTSVIQPSM